MIEDQVAPKRCGHTKGTSVVSRGEAVARVKAACDARDEGQDQDLPWRCWAGIILLGFNRIYSLIMTNIAMENGHGNSELFR